MNVRRLSLQLGLGFALAILGVVSQTPQAQAQRGNLSDVTGAIITTSDIVGGFSPSGGGELIISFRTEEIENSVNSAAGTVNDQLQARNLPIIAIGPQTAIPAAVQQTLEAVMAGSGDVDAGVTQIANSLASAGADPTLAQNLASSLAGLTDGGSVDPAQFRSVVQAYNALIANSNADFLRNPPEFLRGIQSVLSILLNAAFAAV